MSRWSKYKEKQGVKRGLGRQTWGRRTVAGRPDGIGQPFYLKILSGT